MKRRDTIKSLLVGTIAGVSIGTSGCKTEVANELKEAPKTKGYGRTPRELAIDEKLAAEVYLNEHELSTIAVLCDIILPATATAVSASEAEVPAFIEFIVKDIVAHQLPIRGGLMWLDGEATKRYNKQFITLNAQEQLSIIDDIAYPDPEEEKPELGPGINFFNRMRNLTVTGYYTSKAGIDDLGYIGNRPNLWDGVPQEELDRHGFKYEEKYLAQYVDHEKRNEVAQWDESGRLIN